MTDPLSLETIPDQVEVMQFDGTLESAQAIMAWAQSDDIRTILAGDVVALEVLVDNNRVVLAPDTWVVKNLSFEELSYISDERLHDKYRELSDG